MCDRNCREKDFHQQLRLVIDIPGCVSGVNPDVASIVKVAGEFGRYWFAAMPGLITGKHCVLLTDNRDRAAEWSADGGTAIFIASLDSNTADSVLAQLLDLKRKLIDAKSV